jgi:hypothetical protein
MGQAAGRCAASSRAKSSQVCSWRARTVCVATATTTSFNRCSTSFRRASSSTCSAAVAPPGTSPTARFPPKLDDARPVAENNEALAGDAVGAPLLSPPLPPPPVPPLPPPTPKRPFQSLTRLFDLVGDGAPGGGAAAEALLVRHGRKRASERRLVALVVCVGSAPAPAVPPPLLACAADGAAAVLPAPRALSFSAAARLLSLLSSSVRSACQRWQGQTSSVSAVLARGRESAGAGAGEGEGEGEGERARSGLGMDISAPARLRALAAPSRASGCARAPHADRRHPNRSRPPRSRLQALSRVVPRRPRRPRRCCWSVAVHRLERVRAP